MSPDHRPNGNAHAYAHRMLAVGFGSADYSRLVTNFDRDWDVDRLPGGQSALDVLRPCSVDMVVVRHPLPDLELEDFLTGLRSPEASSRQASLVVITDKEHAGDACRFLGRGANRVLSVERAPELLTPMVRALLRVAPRKAVNLPARLELPRLGSFLGVVRNTSATGLLVETGQKPPRGTELSFELDLPDAEKPVLGRAKVVRHTVPDREGVTGLGMRILAFAGLDAGRDYSTFVGTS